MGRRALQSSPPRPKGRWLFTEHTVMHSVGVGQQKGGMVVLEATCEVLQVCPLWFSDGETHGGGLECKGCTLFLKPGGAALELKTGSGLPVLVSAIGRKTRTTRVGSSTALCQEYPSATLEKQVCTIPCTGVSCTHVHVLCCLGGSGPAAGEQGPLEVRSTGPTSLCGDSLTDRERVGWRARGAKDSTDEAAGLCFGHSQACGTPHCGPLHREVLGVGRQSDSLVEPGWHA